MPKYEIMYIIGAHVSDDQIPVTVAEMKQFIEAGSGIIDKHEELGKKKLAYPIKHQRFGYYILSNFSAPANKMKEIEHRVRTSQNIVRHIIINREEDLLRMEKDRRAQAKLKTLRLRPEVKEAKPAKKIEIDLDAEIEKAIGANEELK